MFDSEDGVESPTNVSDETSNVENVEKILSNDEIHSFDEEEMELVENLVETSTSNVVVTSSSNHNFDFGDEFDSVDDDDESNNDQESLNLPSNPQRGQLQEIPRGWLRKVVTTGKARGQQKVFYYNTMGKKFSCREDVEQYFGRLGQTVKPGLFNFDPPKSSEEETQLNGKPTTTC